MTDAEKTPEVAPVVTNVVEDEGEETANSTTVETDEEQVSRISAAIARAKGALEEVRAKVGEYDSQYKASETASAYLGAPIQKAQNAFDELASTVSMLKDKTVEIPTKALTRTLSAANGALEQISEVAHKYDDKFKLSSTVQKAVSVPREKCAAALVEVSTLAASVSAAANAQLQGVNHGICSRALSIASGSANFIFRTAAALDGRFALENKAVNAGTVAAGKAQALDERYKVQERVGSLAATGLERARGLDSSVTGGKVTPVVLSAFEKGLALATDGLAYVQTGYDTAKTERLSLQEAQPTNGGYDAAAADAPAAPAAPAASDDKAA
jgi:hypothetical protein